MILPIEMTNDIKLRKNEVMYELKPIEYFKLIQYLEVEVFQSGKFVCSISIPVHVWQNEETLERLVLHVVRGVSHE